MNTGLSSSRWIVALAAAFLSLAVLPLIADTAAETPPAAPAAGPVETLEDAAFDWDKVTTVLIVYLVFSVVFESAMTPIFNWRLFLRHFDGKGIKTPLTVFLAFVIFWAYDLDIVKDLLVALGQDPKPGQPVESNIGGRILTALLIAGGSDGIFRIFTKLGLRNPTENRKKAETEQAKLKAPANKPAENAG